MVDLTKVVKIEKFGILSLIFENLCTENENREGLETFCMSGGSYGPNIKAFSQTYRSQMDPQ